MSGLGMGLGIIAIGVGLPILAALATIMYTGIKNQIAVRRAPEYEFKVHSEPSPDTEIESSETNE